MSQHAGTHTTGKRRPRSPGTKLISCRPPECWLLAAAGQQWPVSAFDEATPRGGAKIMTSSKRAEAPKHVCSHFAPVSFLLIASFETPQNWRSQASASSPLARSRISSTSTALALGLLRSPFWGDSQVQSRTLKRASERTNGARGGRRSANRSQDKWARPSWRFLVSVQVPERVRHVQVCRLHEIEKLRNWFCCVRASAPKAFSSCLLSSWKSAVVQSPAAYRVR